MNPVTLPQVLTRKYSIMRKPADHVGGFSRFRLDLSYDGTDFAGWAKQPGLRTVQAVVIRALETVFGPSENDFGLRVAGRTDAGVHATAQVCHLNLSDAQLRRLGRSPLSVRRFNSLLPRDVRVRAFAPAPAGFDARFSATYRRYHYLIADNLAVPNPLHGRYQLELESDLDLDAMRQAGSDLLGLRDFGAFCRPRAGSTTIRELRELQIERLVDQSIRIEVEADAFCHNMVRSIVGALIRVGQGRVSREELQQITLDARRSSRFKVVEPQGLTLVAVGYPADSELATQAEKTRSLRSFENEDSV